MYKIILLLLVFISITVTYADSATQTDWSGGPGIWGPVASFGTEFYYDSGVACYSGSGDIALGMIDNVVTHIVNDSFDSPKSVCSEDIDGDGDMDILACAFFDDEVTWWENTDGFGTSWTEHVIDDSFEMAEAVCSKDIDGDGDMDVLGVCHGDNDDITWWENADGTGTSWVKHIIDGTFIAAYDVYSEDIDGDGDMDVISCSAEEGLAWWENAGGTGTVWIIHMVSSEEFISRSIHSNDIDGDGDMDIVSFHLWDVVWWENVTGSGTLWVEHNTGVNVLAPSLGDIYSEDIDGDGDVDIVAGDDGNSLVGDVLWCENTDGTGTSWVRHDVHGYFFHGANSVHASDMDSDGDMDILASAYSEGNIDWFENLDGSGTSWSRHEIDGSFSWPYTVYSADIDGDGIMDVLSGSCYYDFVVWWDVLTYPPVASLMSSVLDTQCSPVWSDIDWTASQPPGTSVGFQVRSSSDPDSTSMGSWSDTLYTPCSLGGILSDGEQYVQYRVVLETSDLDVTPVLHDITLTWNPVGIQVEPEPDSFELLPFHPNPASSTPVIRFGLPEASSVELDVFDVAGRLVQRISTEEYSAGYHSIVLGELTPGIYFCRIICGDFTEVQRLVVIE